MTTETRYFANPTDPGQVVAAQVTVDEDGQPTSGVPLSTDPPTLHRVVDDSEVDRATAQALIAAGETVEARYSTPGVPWVEITEADYLSATLEAATRPAPEPGVDPLDGFPQWVRDTIFAAELARVQSAGTDPAPMPDTADLEWADDGTAPTDPALITAGDVTSGALLGAGVAVTDLATALAGEHYAEVKFRPAGPVTVSGFTVTADGAARVAVVVGDTIVHDDDQAPDGSGPTGFGFGSVTSPAGVEQHARFYFYGPDPVGPVTGVGLVTTTNTDDENG